MRGALTAGVGILARGANQVVMIVITLVATRFLSPAQFGVFSLAAAGVTLVRTLLYVGAFEYLLKAPKPERISAICLLLNLVLSVGLSGVLVVGAVLAGPAFGTTDLTKILLWMAPSNVIAALSAWQEAQILRGKGLRPYYGITAFGEVVAGAGAVALLFAGWGVMALVAQAYARTIVLALGYAALQRPNLKGEISWPLFKEVVLWSKDRYSAVMVSFTANYGADFVLGALLSPAATGLFRAASRITTAVSDLFVQPATLISSTIFSRRAAAGVGSGEIWPRILLALGFIGWPALAGLAVVGSELAPQVLGKAWAGTGSVIAILCVARAGALLGAVATPYLVSYSRQRTVLLVQGVTAAVMVVVLLATARFGLTSAAGGVAAVLLTSNGWLLLQAMRLDPQPAAVLRKNGVIAAAAVIATGVAAQFGLWFLPPAPWRMAAAIALGCIAWALVVLPARRSIMHAVHALEPE